MSIEQKSKYVAPSTRRDTVELEQGFMSSSIGDVKEDTESITINEQDPGVAIGTDHDHGGTWDNDSWD